MSGGAADEHTVDLTVDVQRGTPIAEELAALIAVVTEAYADESAQATVDETSGRSAWSVSQRALRQPLRRDIGWGRFG
ncbi:acyl-CoA carboxylase subunit epsilon [Microbacterium pygmaeum]|uniref:Acyl-CoA carboxylase epsilon subunit n=1 Tax=Microbacterium pygmaeum TaxID=370764 RepID=A0A1G8CWB0_9MICO|nr:acyl-CoA carboxylase subunit epsilon [Microbacterium pygmaeum]SDH49429.1 Acyl-CoA carboxylase epsilon subunit [Microbacterium pygmaeum]